MKKGKHVLIISASIGTGHAQAAKAIEEYWDVYDPEAVVEHADFLDNETLSVDGLLKETYIKMIDVFPMLYDLVYHASQGERKGGIAQTLLSWVLKRRMFKLIQKKRPDVVIFTHPFPCGAASLLKRKKLIDVPIMAVITDFTSHQFWVYPQVDAYFVGSESMVDDLAKAGIDRSKIAVTGIPVRRRFFEEADKPRPADAPTTVLIMGGGLGHGPLETALLQLDDIGSIAGVDEFIVVAGRNLGLYESLVDIKDRMRTKTTVYGYTTEIPELMRRSALLVTKPGGLTCMEAVTVGTPLVFFNAIPGQEEANALHLERKGCARWARDVNNLPDVVMALLINPQRLRAMSEAELAWRVDGAADIVSNVQRFFGEKSGA